MTEARAYFNLGKKYLVYNLVARNLKVKYRRSVFGVFWTLIAPISLALTYYFVFGHVLQVKLPHYLAHMVASVLAWNFFAGTVNESIDGMIQNQALISKIPIPVQIFPWVTSVTNAITLSLSVPVIAATFWISGVEINAAILLLPVLALALFLAVYGLSLTFAIGVVFFRDIKHGMSIVLQLWLYATPVFYDRDIVPERFRFLFYANPLAAIWSCLQDVTLKGRLPAPEMAAVAAGWTLAITLLAYFVTARFGRKVAEEI